MPHNLTDVSAFSTATAPVGADIRNAASVEAVAQWAANRTRYLYDRTTALADLTALAAISAPAARYASSLQLAESPAPVSTMTLKPSLISFSTTSGTVATRFSPAKTSLGTPISSDILGSPLTSR
jgi:hypothetical protein